ncbi:MAG: transporter, partial [Aeromicrobium sp.]|nr:transporter [Aeromicrobium sp.]
MSPTFSALAVRNYRIYIIGAIVSNTGTWMQ